MGRTARIDRDKLLADLRAGMNDTDAGHKHDCSRQCIQQWRGKFVSSGDLAGNERKGHTKSNGGNGKSARKVVKATRVISQVVPAAEVSIEPVSLAWEPTQNALYKIMLQARVAQKLAIMYQQLKEDYDRVKAENERLHKTASMKQRWDLAQQQGEIANLTEHISVRILLTVLIRRYCLNIISRTLNCEYSLT